MTSKRRRNHSHTAVVSFAVLLVTFIAFSALVQVMEAGQSSGQRSVESPPQHSGAPGSPKTKLGLGSMDGYALAFAPAVTYYLDSNPNDVAIGDLNGDGRPDLFSANLHYQHGSVAVLLGNGDGTFQRPLDYSSGGPNAASVTVADVNEDGREDAIVANSGGSVGVLLASRYGRLQQVVSYWGGNEPHSVAAGDVNGDGHLDLVVSDLCSAFNCSTGEVSVLLGNGDGTFQPAVAYSSGGYHPVSIAIGDVNGDGKPDLLSASLCGVFNCSTGEVSVLLGNGDGTFQPAAAYSSGGYRAVSIAIGDVNLDGHLDLIVANACETPDQNGSCYTQSGHVSILLGNGDGTFQPPVGYSSGGLVATSVAIGDMNGDGKPDVVLANLSLSAENNVDAVGVLLGNGDGTFQSAVAYGLGHFATATVTIADLNGDGRPDIAASNGSGSLSVLLNTSGTNMPTTTALASSLDPAPPNKVVTYTATVLGQSGGEATGTVVFKDSGTTIAAIPVASNQAAYSTTYRAGGVHAITAVYTGDWDNAGSTSATLTQFIQSLSKSSLTTSSSPAFVGQPVTFTAAVSSAAGTIPDGELVTFYDGTNAIGTGTTAGGVATFTTSSLTVKTHTIKAIYPGDATFEPSTGSVTQVVDKYPTTTALSSSRNPSNYGQAVTLRATVTPTGPYPLTGTVTFWDGRLVIGMATLSGGVATVTKPKLAVGTHSITATYSGNARNAKSVSPAITQTVSQTSISMVLTSAPNPSTFGTSVKFTAKMTSNGGLPSGQPVTFSYNGGTLGTANVSNTGLATFSTTTLPRGSDVVTAAYAGSVGYSSASATVTQVVH